MKRWLIIALIIAMVFTLCSCGQKSASDPDTAGETAESEDNDANAAEDIALEDLQGTWINVDNGDILTFDSDNRVSLDIADESMSVGGFSGGSRDLDGGIIAGLCYDEDFEIVSDNGQLKLVGADSGATFMRTDDYYLFEEADVYQLGDTVATDCVEFTLQGFSFADEIDTSDAKVQKWADTWDEELIPDESGMVWGVVSYGLNNISKSAVMTIGLGTNILETVVYDDGYTFDMSANTYIRVGDGSDDHVAWKGAVGGSNHEIAALVSENYVDYIPVAAALADDAAAPMHIVVMLPSSEGTQLFVYDVTGAVSNATSATGGESLDSADVYGTWEVVAVDTGSNYLTVEEMEEGGVQSWSDWDMIINDQNELYLQTNSTSITGEVEIDGDTVTAGRNVWNYQDGQLVLALDSSTTYWEKIDDNQEFPEIAKADIAEMLQGTWVTDGGDTTGSFTFDGENTTAIINGTEIDMDTLCILTDENQIVISTTVSGSLVAMVLGYTYDDGVFSLLYAENPLVRQ